MPPFAKTQRHRTDKRLIQPAEAVNTRFDKVSGNLFQHELCEGYIGVERADEVVTIPPCIFGGHIPFVAMCVRVMNNIHPVPRPTFAKVRAIE